MGVTPESLKLAMGLARHGVRVYFWDWPPLSEILTRLITGLTPLRLEDIRDCRFSSILISLRGDDEFNTAKNIIENCYFDIIVNLSHVSSPIARYLHKIASSNGRDYIEIQFVKADIRDAILVSGTVVIPEILETVLKSISSNIIKTIFPPGSLVFFNIILSLIARGVLGPEEFARFSEYFGVKMEVLRKVLEDLNYRYLTSYK